MILVINFAEARNWVGGEEVCAANGNSTWFAPIVTRLAYLE